MVPPKYAARARQLMGVYTKWARMNDEPFLSKGHKRHMVVDFASKSARGTFTSGSGAYKRHSLLAKEGWKNGNKRVVWFMEKMRPGWDPDHGDWFYATVGADGTVMNAGRVQNCIDCHDRADNDYVFGLPK